MGAHEFGHVELAVTGDTSVGGIFTIATDGTPGLATFLLAGGAPGELPVPPYGALFVDPAGLLVIPWGSAPFALPTSVGFPATLELQALALGGAGGNLSNAVRVEVE